MVPDVKTCAAAKNPFLKKICLAVFSENLFKMRYPRIEENNFRVSLNLTAVTFTVITTRICTLSSSIRHTNN